MSLRLYPNPLQRTPSISAVLYLFLFLLTVTVKAERLDGRHSFSLTTFNPVGKLGQVERATQAASLGTPVVALKYRNEILMGCPQALPSPLVHDDGTARFCRITRNIVVSHSGLGADGRVVVAAAQRMAVEHAYTFDEAIPIELFLEEVSLLFQEYTMKPASRPFGCTLLVAHVPDPDEIDNHGDEPELYRVDPSGSVESLRTVLSIGSVRSGDFIASLEELANQLDEDDVTETRGKLVDMLKSHFHKSAPSSEKAEDGNLPFLTATLNADGLVVRRHSASSK